MKVISPEYIQEKYNPYKPIDPSPLRNEIKPSENSHESPKSKLTIYFEKQIKGLRENEIFSKYKK